jgi:hypothetical protein
MTTTTRTLLLLAAALLAACGASSSSGPVTPAGASANLLLKGAITSRSAGRIEVNGVTVDTPATVRIEGVERPESELQDGMQVRVKLHADATGRHGEGLEIQAEDAVKGKVEARDATTISVGGQTVRVDDSTHFEDEAGRLDSIQAGDRVRVSGVADDRGGLRATRIDKLAGTSDDFEVKGIVSELSAGGFTLLLSPDAGPADTYTVNLLGGATLPAGMANGALVEVRSLKPVQAGNVIEASAVVIEDRLTGAPGSEAEVEGIVTSGTAASFVLDGVTVTTSDATSWTGGLPADLLPGARVEAEGSLDSNGVLSARKVTFEASARLVGTAGALALDGGGLGSLTVDGVTVVIDALTEQRDAAASLAAGEWIEVRGAPGRDGTSLVATRLSRSGDQRPAITGVVSAKDAAAGTLTILGKTIATGAVEADGFHGQGDASGASGAPLPSSAFFAAVTVGQTIVEARGKDAAAFADPVLTAREVELEGDR